MNREKLYELAIRYANIPINLEELTSKLNEFRREISLLTHLCLEHLGF